MASPNPDLIQRLALNASLKAYKVGAHFKAVIEGALMAPLDSSYTQIHLISVQVCDRILADDQEKSRVNNRALTWPKVPRVGKGRWRGSCRKNQLDTAF